VLLLHFLLNGITSILVKDGRFIFNFQGSYWLVKYHVGSFVKNDRPVTKSHMDLKIPLRSYLMRALVAWSAFCEGGALYEPGTQTKDLVTHRKSRDNMQYPK
jgi:hypothetical protein